MLEIKSQHEPLRSLEISNKPDSNKNIKIRISSGDLVCTHIWLNAKEIKILHAHLEELLSVIEFNEEYRAYMKEMLNQEF